MERIAEVAMFTSQVEAVAHFYEQILGVPPAYRREGIAIFEIGKTTVLIHRKTQAEPGQPPNEDHVGIDVADLTKTCEMLARQGVTVEVEPQRYYWGRSMYVRDPDGRLIELHEEGSENETEAT